MIITQVYQYFLAVVFKTSIDLTRVAVPDEDTDMEATNHKIDAELSSYQVACFPTDHTRLVQACDGIDNTTTDDSSSSSNSESDSDDEPQLVSILPDTPSLENSVPWHAVKKKKKQVRKPKNPRGKYTPHSSDLMKQSLFLKLCGHSNKEISNMLNIPEATIRDHSPSTIYHHLVKKCRITIKRAHPYPQRRTDDVTKDRRVTFIKDYIHSGIVYYQKNCVFVDETPINGNMRGNYGWVPVNQAAHVHVPQM
ncbi:hypothetical protein BDC45DRAFT_542426 [Circinella umbellata]|nr:hypothetical protein BDC45DRAFT_542426 [Circinella umbellata]